MECHIADDLGWEEVGDAGVKYGETAGVVVCDEAIGSAEFR